MAEVSQVVELAQQQQDGVCPECRASSEYWELGDEFPYPSGWWVGQATQIAKEKNLDLKESLQLIFGLAITGELFESLTYAVYPFLRFCSRRYILLDIYIL